VILLFLTPRGKQFFQLGVARRKHSKLALVMKDRPEENKERKEKKNGG
jgi:hypothetical protein